jgi:glycosyltransferase involved in cell wall biosynthesis
MPTVLFQTVHRTDRSPSQRFRFEQYLCFFEENGWECQFSWLLNPWQDRVYYSNGNWVSKAGIIAKSTCKRWKETLTRSADVVFVQREAYMLGSSWFERQMAKHAALVFDFDDAIWLSDVSEKNRRFAFLKSKRKTAKLISTSDEVIAGNDFLADYARRHNDRIHVIPTTIDTAYHRPMPKLRKGKPLCIGWTGSLTTLQYFKDLVPVLERIKDRYGAAVRFKVIGEPGYRNEALDLQSTPWNLETEIEDLNDIDIGIMPLPDNEWTKGKCGFKGLQYMGCGIPTVMSPVGVNAHIVEHDVNGYLAGNEEDWYTILCCLIDSEPLRTRIGRAGRATVEERYSVESQKQHYLAVLNRAYANRPQK